VLGIERQAALRVIASEVLQAFGGAPQQTDSRGAVGYGPSDPSALGAVAQALREAVQHAGGGDPVPQLLEKIEAGLASARQALGGLGWDDAAINDAIGEFRDRVSSLVNVPTAPPASAPESVTAVSAQTVRKERASLSLMTQDGDVVTIRYRHRESDRVDVAQVSTDGSTTVSAAIDSKSSTRVKVEVTGELDEGQLAAIEDFLGRVGALADEFFNGQVEEAFAAGATLGFDAGEIAGFSLRLSVTERIRLQAIDQSFVPHAAGTAPASVERLPAQAAPRVPLPTELPAAATAASVPAAALQPETPSALTSAPASNMTRAYEAITAYVRRVLVAAETPLTLGGIDVAWSSKIRLVAAAIERAPQASTPNSGAGPALLGNVLDAVAANGARASGADAPAKAA
jgi:hypothetical protein